MIGPRSDKKCYTITSSETAASPGATLCKFTSGRRISKAKYCKEAWGWKENLCDLAKTVTGEPEPWAGE